MSQRKATVLLEHYLKALRLPTMGREYGKLAAVCQADRADYPTYLLRLAEREVQDREVRAAERRVKAAKFPVVKTLDTFDFAAQPSLNQALVRELVRGEYMDQRENILLIVLDELGYVPFTKAGAELLFEVVSRAYERTSLLVTTNLPFEAWTEVLGNERLTGALLDRLTHRIHILEANGESYRLRESRRRLKRSTTTRTARNTS